jgi:RNA polymerase sigma factor (sigma-70 family)
MTPSRRQEPGAGIRRRPVTSSRRTVKVQSHAEQVELLERVKAGDQAARHALVMGNVGLVHQIVRAMHVAGRDTFPTFADYVQEAILMLLQKVELWDPSLGSFATWAGFWVRSVVSRSRRVNSSLVSTGHESIRAHCERAMIDAATDKEYRRRDASRRMLGAMHVVSLDAPLIPCGEDDAATRGEMLQNGEPSPEQMMIDADRGKRAREAASHLPEKLRDVLLARMRGDTLGEISVRLGYSRQRVLQIEEEALLKLQSVLRAQALEAERSAILSRWRGVRRVDGGSGPSRNRREERPIASPR